MCSCVCDAQCCIIDVNEDVRKEPPNPHPPNPHEPVELPGKQAVVNVVNQSHQQAAVTRSVFHPPAAQVYSNSSCQLLYVVTGSMN